MFTAVDHVAICLPQSDFQNTARRYAEIFGYGEVFEEKIVVGGIPGTRWINQPPPAIQIV